MHNDGVYVSIAVRRHDVTASRLFLRMHIRVYLKIKVHFLVSLAEK